MFIKLTGFYGTVYVRVDQIRNFEINRNGNTVIRFIRDEGDVISVKETPDEIMKEIERITKK